MGSLQVIDIVVIFAYVVLFIVIGIWAGKRVKNSKDFTSAGQSMGLALVAGSTIATCMGASILFSNYELIRNTGMAGFVSMSAWYVGWIFLVVMSKKLRDSGTTSIPGFLELRYDSNTRKYTSWFVLLMGFSSTAAQFLALGTSCQALGLTDTTTGTIVGAIIIVAFTIFSGLWGVAMTDTIQSILLLIGCGIIIPIATFKVAGGPVHVFTNIDPVMLDFSRGMTPLAFVGLLLANSFNAGAHPAYSQRIFAAKDTKTAVTGQTIALVVCWLVAVLAGLGAFTMPFIFPDVTNGAEFIPRFISAYFPPIASGVMMAAILGLLLTTGDTFLMLISSTVVDDIIRPAKPNMEEKKLLNISRIVIVAAAVVIVVLALYVDSIFELFRLGGSAYGAAVFIPLLLGCYWKKAHKKAINVAALVGGFTSFAWDFLKLNGKTGIRGVIPGALLCLIICVIGSIIINSKESKSRGTPVPVAD